MAGVRNKFRVPSAGCLYGCHPQRPKLNTELYLPRTLVSIDMCKVAKQIVYWSVLAAG